MAISTVEPIGVVESVDGELTVFREDGSEATLTQGDAIYMNDQVFTDGPSTASIRFDDGSSADVAENTSLLVDEYVYQPEQVASNTNIEAAVKDVVAEAAAPVIAVSSHGEPAGKVESMDGSAIVYHMDGSEGDLQFGDFVYPDDEIFTDEASAVAIRFSDETSFSIGENSTLVIDEYVYDAETGEGTVDVAVLKGMFVFVSGLVADKDPDSMNIKTPSATIGIRGTEGMGKVGENEGESYFVNADGVITISTKHGTVVIDQINQTAVVLSPALPPKMAKAWTSEQVIKTFVSALRVAPFSVTERVVKADLSLGGDARSILNKAIKAMKAKDAEEKAADGEGGGDGDGKGEGKGDGEEKESEEDDGEDEEEVSEDGEGEEEEGEEEEGEEEEGEEEEGEEETAEEETAEEETAEEETAEEETAEEETAEEETAEEETAEEETAEEETAEEETAEEETAEKEAAEEEAAEGETAEEGAGEENSGQEDSGEDASQGDGGDDSGDQADSGSEELVYVSVVIDFSDGGDDSDEDSATEESVEEILSQVEANTRDLIEDTGIEDVVETVVVEQNQEEEPENLNTQPTTFDVAGLAVDSYIANATVFFDADGDGELDVGEISTVTDAQGNYSLVLPSDASGSIVVLAGGTDLATNETVKVNLSTPVDVALAASGTLVVSPLSSLLDSLIKSGQTQAEATATVRQITGVTDQNLLTTDPVELALAGNADGIALLQLNVKIHAIIALATSAIIGASGGSVAAGDASTALFSALAAQFVDVADNGGDIDVTALLNSATQNLGVSVSAADTSALAGLIDTVTEAADVSNAAGLSPSEQLTRLVQISDLTQNGLANDIQQSFTGGSFQQDFETELAAGSIDARIASIGADQLGVLDPDNLDVGFTVSNLAPVQNSGEIALTDIAVNSAAPVEGDTGTLVSALLAAQNASDGDNGVVGIAVTQVSGGSWHFSNDNGTSWTVITLASEEALPLAADAELYFQPDANIAGANIGSLGFVAWDGTQGLAGENTATTGFGGDTAFSEQVATATVDVFDNPFANGQFAVTQGNVTLITLDTDIDSALIPNTDLVTVGFSEVVGGAFRNNSSGETGITQATLTQVIDGQIEFVQNGSNAETPAFAITYDTGTVAFSAVSQSIEFTIANAPPAAIDDAAAVNEDEANPILINVLENDSDIDSAGINLASINTANTQGIASISGDSIAYDPNGQFDSLAQGETALDTVQYTIADTLGAESTATASITITGQNDAPVAAADTLSVNENTPTTVVDVLTNDTDIDASDVLRVTQLDTAATAGAVTLVDGVVNYNPNGQFESLGVGETANDTFSYTVEDSQGVSNTATVTVIVNGVNDAPVVGNDSFSVDEDGSLSGIPGVNGLLDNSSDVDGDALSVVTASVTAPSNGSLNVFADGSFTYSPNTDFNGIDSFTYEVSDDNGGSTQATASITVNAVDDAPVNTVPAAQTVVEDGSLLFAAGNSNQLSVFDADNDVVSVDLSVLFGVLLVTAQGAASVAGDNTNSVTISGSQADIISTLGVLSYLPNVDFNGTDTLTVVSTDASSTPLTDTDTVTINVASVDDAPVNTVPASQTVAEDGSLLFASGNSNQLSVFDADNDIVSVDLSVLFGVLLATAQGSASVVGDSTGSVTITGSQADIINTLAVLSYLPNVDFNGPDTFTVVSTDASGSPLTDTDTVTINVTPVEDAPVNTVPAAQTVAEDGSLLFDFGNSNQLSVFDADNDIVSVDLSVLSGVLLVTAQASASVIGDSTGNVTISGSQADIISTLGVLSYLPNADFNGPDTLTVVSTDASGTPLTDTDTVTINVTSVDDTPVNTIPAAQTVAEDTLLVFQSGNGNQITMSDVDDNIASVDISVDAGTLNVTAQGGASVSGNGGSNLTISGSQIDIIGTLAVLTYQANADFNGPDTLTIVTTDASGSPLADSDTVTINVTPVEDAPVNTVPAAQTVAEDGSLLFDFGNSNQLSVFDADNDIVSVDLSVLSGILLVTAQGSASVIGDSTDNLTISGSQADIINTLAVLSYLPNADFNGPDTLTMVSTDASGTPLTDTDIVTINVTSVEDAPVNTVPASQTVDEDTPLVFQASNGNQITVSDVDNNIVSVDVSVTAGTLSVTGQGSASVVGNNTNSVTINGSQSDIITTLSVLSYVPDANFNGPDTLTVVSTDASGSPLTDTNTVTINVTSVDDAPVNTVPAAQTVAEDTPLVFQSGNGNQITVSDVDDNIASVNVSVGAGTVTVSAQGSASVSGNGTSGLIISGSQTDIIGTLAVLTYQGNADFNGPDTLTVIATDTSGTPLTDTDTVAITVTPVNDAPVAVNDAFSVDEDGSLSATVTANDSDIDGGVLVASVLDNVATGSLVLNSEGVFTYAPNADFNGSDSFTYEIDDGNGGVTQATATITVNPINDSPELIPDSLNLDYSVAGQVFTSAAAPNGARISNDGQVAISVGSEGGNNYINFYVFNGASGEFEFDSSELIAASSTPDAPIYTTLINLGDGQYQSLVFDQNNQSFSAYQFSQGTSGLDVFVTATSGAAPFSILSAPIDAGAGNLFDFYNSEQVAASVVNDDGFVNIAYANGAEITVIQLDTRAPSLTLNTLDTLTTATTAGFVGSSSIAFGFGGDLLYVSNDNNADIQIFSDTGSGFALATTLLAGVDIPAMANDQFLERSPDGTQLYVVEQSDSAGVAATLYIFAIIIEGENAVIEGQLRLVESFPLVDDAGVAVEAVSQLLVGQQNTVIAVSEADGRLVSFNHAVDYLLTINEDSNAPIDGVTTGRTVASFLSATDIDGDSVGIAVGGLNGRGDWYFSTNNGATWQFLDDRALASEVDDLLLLLDDSSQLYYQPAADENGDNIATLRYVAWDGTEGSAGTIFAVPAFGAGAFGDSVGVLHASVDPVNDVPVAADDSFSMLEDGQLVDSITNNDFDIDGDLIQVNIAPVVDPNNGSLSLSVDGNFTYTPNANFNGSDSFTYEVSDGHGGTAQAIVNITVDPVNDAPTLDIDGITAVDYSVIGQAFDFVGAPGGFIVSPDGKFAISTGHDAGNNYINFFVFNDTTAEFDLDSTQLIGASSNPEAVIYTSLGDPSGGRYQAAVFNSEDARFDVFEFSDGSSSLDITRVANNAPFSILDAPVSNGPNTDNLFDLFDRSHAAGSSPDDDGSVRLAYGNGTEITVLRLENGVFSFENTLIAGSTPSFNGSSSIAFGFNNNVLYVTQDSSADIQVFEDNGGTYELVQTLVAGVDIPAMSSEQLLQLSPDGTQLYVVEQSDTAGVAAQLYVFDLAIADGSAPAGALLHTLGPISLSDGVNPIDTVSQIDVQDLDTVVIVAEDGRIATLSQPVGRLMATDEDSGPPIDGVTTGATVASFLNASDVDVGDTLGIALGGAVGQGNWYFSIDNGASWQHHDFGSQAGGALLLLGPDAQLYYEPVADENGDAIASLAYAAWDGTVGSSGAVHVVSSFSDPEGAFGQFANRVYANITPTNDAPTGVDSSFELSEDSSLSTSGGSLFSDSFDIDGDALTVNTTPIFDVNNGSLSLAAEGDFTYTPNDDFNGTDSFTYAFSDGNGETAQATVNLFINPVEDAPVNTVPIAQTVAEDTSLVFQLGNSNEIAVADVDNNIVSVAVSANNGTLTVTAQGGASISGNSSSSLVITGGQNEIVGTLAVLTYQGNTNFNGTDILTVVTTDVSSTPVTDTVTINVTPVDDAPVNIVPATQTVAEDTPLIFQAANGNEIKVDDADNNIVSVDVSVMNGMLSATAQGGASVTERNGPSLSIIGSQTDIQSTLAVLTYQGNTDFNGTDTLTVVSADSSGTALTDTDTVTINVTPVNDLPVANANPVITVDQNNGPIIIDLTENVFDAEGDAVAAVDIFLDYSDRIVGNLDAGEFVDLTDGESESITVSYNVIEVGRAFNQSIQNINLSNSGKFYVVDPITQVMTAVFQNASIVTAADAVASLGLDDAAVVFVGVDNTGWSASASYFLDGLETAIDANDFVVFSYDGTPLISSPLISFDADAALVKLALMFTVFDPIRGDLTYDFSVNGINFNVGVNNLEISGVDVDVSPERVSGGTQTIIVNGVNDTPVNTVPATQTVAEDGSLLFDSGNSNQLSVFDADNDIVSVDLTVLSGILLATAQGSASVTGDNSSSLTITGSQADIISTLGVLSYLPNADFNGPDTLTVVSTDASGTPLTDTDTVTINVTSVDDAPVNTVPASQTVDEDTPLVFQASNGNQITVSDVDNNIASVTVSAGAGTLNVTVQGGASLMGNGTPSLTISGSQIDIIGTLAVLTYQGNANFSGPDILTVVTTDASGSPLTDTDTIAITVTPVADAPIAVADSYTTPEDTPFNTITSSVLLNDNDPDGDALTSTLVTGPSFGSLGSAGLALDGTFTYIPNSNYNGSDSFTYEANDGNGGMAQATVSINITSVNDAPVNTVPATQTVNEGATLVFNAANSNQISVSDVDDNLASVQLSVTGGTISVMTVGTAIASDNGTATVTITGTQSDINSTLAAVNYQAPADIGGGGGGSDSVLLDIISIDSGGTPLSDSGSFTININAVNQPPTGVDDDHTVNEASSITVVALDNDIEPDGDNLSVIAIRTGTELGSGVAGSLDIGLAGDYGTLTIDSNGLFTYVADLEAANVLADGETAFDYFTYTLDDGFSGTDTAEIAITVTGVNDAPIAFDDTVVMNEDTPLSRDAASGVVGDNDTDVDASDVLFVSAIRTGTELAGSGTNGTVDTGLAGDYGTLTLLSDGSFNYVIDLPAGIGLSGGETATDFFTYTVSDGNGGLDTGQLDINITGENDTPTAVNDTLVVTEDTPFIGNVGTNDGDVDNGDTLTFSLDSGPSFGVLSGGGSSGLDTDGSFTYTPNNNYDGTDSFTYDVNDGNGGTAQATVNISVTAVNDAPIASDDTNSVNEDATLTVAQATGLIDLNDNDLDGGTLFIADIRTGTELGGGTGGTVGVGLVGTYGTLTVEGDGSYVYVADQAAADLLAAAASATDVFTYTVDDGNSGTDIAELVITVNGLSDAPIAVDDTGGGATLDVLENDTLMVGGASGVLLNDSDLDNDGFTVTAIRTGTEAGSGTAGDVGLALTGKHGDLTLFSDGSYNYVANDDAIAAGAVVTDTFTYTIDDSVDGTDQAELVISITGVNDAPTMAIETIITVIGVGSPAALFEFTEGGPFIFDAELNGLNNGLGDYTGASVFIDVTPSALQESTVAFFDSGSNFGASSLDVVGNDVIKNNEIIASISSVADNFQLDFVTNNSEFANQDDVNEILAVVDVTLTNVVGTSVGISFDEGTFGGDGVVDFTASISLVNGGVA